MSHKFNHSGVRYKVAVCIQTGYIVWINGPYACGSYPDKKIFAEWLKQELEPRERVEVDRGYTGDPTFSTHDNFSKIVAGNA